MKLHQLTKITTRGKKRVGRGIGSGRGKTSGRGTKGQKARENVPQFLSLAFLYKRIPYRRGLRNAKRSAKAVVVDISKLAAFEKNSTVDMQSMIEKKLISGRQATKLGVKIVGSGDLSTALTVKLPTSEPAKIAIEKAGGKVVRE